MPPMPPKPPGAPQVAPSANNNNHNNDISMHGRLARLVRRLPKEVSDGWTIRLTKTAGVNGNNNRYSYARNGRTFVSFKAALNHQHTP